MNRPSNQTRPRNAAGKLARPFAGAEFASPYLFTVIFTNREATQANRACTNQVQFASAASSIHDWNDDQAREILKSVRRSAESGARLLLIETVMPETCQAHLAHGLDILMLAFVGGKERTRKEYAALLESAGFLLNRVVPAESGHSIVEAVAV